MKQFQYLGMKMVARMIVTGLFLSLPAISFALATQNTQVTQTTREMGVDPYAAKNPNEVHQIKKIKGDLYRFTVDQGKVAHSSAFLVTKEGIILTDPIRTSAALWLKEELAKRFKVPVKYVVYSHAHFDHIGGAQVFQKEGAVVVAHENAVGPIIGEKLPTAVPDQTFKESLEIKLGEAIVKLTHVAPSHSNSMIMISFPKERTIMAVDFVPIGSLPYNDFLDFYYDGWIKSLEWLRDQDFDILEGGHYELGNKKEVEINLEYMKSLHDQVLNLVRQGQSWDQLWRNVHFDDKFKSRNGYENMRIHNIRGMYQWVSNHRRGIW